MWGVLIVVRIVMWGVVWEKFFDGFDSCVRGDVRGMIVVWGHMIVVRGRMIVVWEKLSEEYDCCVRGFESWVRGDASCVRCGDSCVSVRMLVFGYLLEEEHPSCKLEEDRRHGRLSSLLPLYMTGRHCCQTGLACNGGVTVYKSSVVFIWIGKWDHFPLNKVDS